MRHFISVLFLLLNATFANAQQDSISPPPVPRDSTRNKLPLKSKGMDSLSQKKEGTTAIKDYKIISYSRDTTFLDTSLTIQKEYKYNFLRRDDFELIPFANIGQPYNTLGVQFSDRHYYPRLGALGRNFNYQETEEINYYDVATPVSDLMFKTTLEQGQLLDALLAFNVNKRLNLSVGFKGFRSLGKYQFNQAQSGNFKTTFNYRTENDRYRIRGHIAAQDLDSEENGGIANREQFENDPEGDFTDRVRIDVLFTNANNRILGKRYYFDHQFLLFGGEQDSIKKRKSQVRIGHEFNYETKFYEFVQTAQENAFGEDVFLTPIEDKARLKTMFNRVSAEFSNSTLGRITGNASLYNYNYFFNSILITDTQTIQNQIEGEEISVGGTYFNQFGNLVLKGDVNYTVSGELTGNAFNFSSIYQINENTTVSGGVHLASRLPNFNYLLYQSDYQNFNWQNDSLFEKQQNQAITFNLDSNKWGLLEAEYSAIDNYSFFASTITDEQRAAGLAETAFVRPFQESETVNHLRIKYFKEFKWRKWALANTVLFQDVTQNQQVLNVPELITRNSLYFSSDVFKKAMYLQTGVTFKYFTSYNMNAYHPLLGEFYIQNEEEFGGFPLLDFFINARVKQTRIYFKLEHFNSSFSEPIFYSAPNYPYRDFVIRFGLVWNFFS
ncbi:putative porin [Flagellimonas meridianipacifica]|uniref:Putative beta-barrel porin n=1 Tax=Flagellimonas meridianipacifica TaxID=1080225 RepID=A0A2T0MEM3_9FLAO|nr:putative porin [Allomuricauda pacifica]PRX56013.1 putative beta-barrel porin [Allomuricauda pacifica]